jgi:hypothetical protein
MLGAQGGIRGIQRKSTKNVNCFFIASSGSMAADGRTELVAHLAYEHCNAFGADSTDVYCNDEGRIHYLGNIGQRGGAFGHDMVFFPYGGSEDWVNPLIVAGLAETYNHLFYVEDGDSMVDVIAEANDIIESNTKITGFLIRNAAEKKVIERYLEFATKKGVNLLAQSPPRWER